MANKTFDVGYRYKVINNLEFESDTSTTFDFDADYKSHNILAGIRFNF
jgi:opacity protein-like surface antigen